VRARLADRHVQLERLAVVAQIERADEPLLLGGEAFEPQLVACRVLHLAEELECHGEAIAQRADPRPDVVVLDL